MKISSSVSFGLLATRILAASASRPRRGVKNGILGGVGPYLPPGSVQEQYSTIWAGGQISAPDNDGIVHVNATFQVPMSAAPGTGAYIFVSFCTDVGGCSNEDIADDPGIEVLGGIYMNFATDGSKTLQPFMQYYPYAPEFTQFPFSIAAGDVLHVSANCSFGGAAMIINNINTGKEHSQYMIVVGDPVIAYTAQLGVLQSQATLMDFGTVTFSEASVLTGKGQYLDLSEASMWEIINATTGIQNRPTVTNGPITSVNGITNYTRFAYGKVLSDTSLSVIYSGP